MANNDYRAEFLYDNLMIEANIIHAAYLTKVRKLLFLGSSCIYPKLAPQPLKEESLLTGLLEPTNEPYAIAKIAGINCAKLIEVNMDAISSLLCQPIFMDRMIIMILKIPMYCLQ
jgi:GDP-L-fucose synthase